MKILLTGGGSGGHFYPLIAVAREIIKISRERRILEPKLIYASDKPYDAKALYEENISFLKLPAGKIRRYFSFWNFIDPFKMLLGSLKAIIKIYIEMPDVIFSKGGYAAMPTLIAAKFLKIPLVIHESDSVPGKANLFVKDFASRIAISFEESASYFPKEKIALTGNPVRKTIIGGNFLEAADVLQLKSISEKFSPPVILIIGGSQGAKKINDTVLEILPELLKNYQIIHQCGSRNLEEVKEVSDVVLKDSVYKGHYHLMDFLNETQIKNAAFAASVVVSRASAGAIFEIAMWEKPSILIPLPEDVDAQNHQKKNAWSFAARGAAEVIEQENLSPHILMSEINNIIKDTDKQEKMKIAAKGFSKPLAAEKIAEEIINLALEHAQ